MASARSKPGRERVRFGEGVSTVMFVMDSSHGTLAPRFGYDPVDLLRTDVHTGGKIGRKMGEKKARSKRDFGPLPLKDGKNCPKKAFPMFRPFFPHFPGLW